MTRLPLVVACLLLVPLAPLAGADEEPTIIELKGKAPDWWTPEVAAAADAAGQEGKLLNPLTGETFTPQAAAAVADIPVGAPDYLFVRPGALFLTLSIGGVGGLCTYNFIYSSGTQIGTAGHCVSYVGQPVYILAVTPGPTPLITPLGKVASFRNGGIGDDWALININATWQPWVDPNMAYLGGPSCSAWNGSLSVVKHVGHGIQTGVIAAVPRVSQAFASDGKAFSGAGEVSGGDSGSLMIQVTPSAGCALGAAAGIVTHCASIGGTVCIPLYWATDVRSVPATVTVGFDPL